MLRGAGAGAAGTGPSKNVYRSGAKSLLWGRQARRSASTGCRHAEGKAAGLSPSKPGEGRVYGLDSRTFGPLEATADAAPAAKSSSTTSSVWFAAVVATDSDATAT